MNFDKNYYGPQGVTPDDRQYAGSRFSDVRKALFENAYYLTWGAAGEPPLPVYDSTLCHFLRGLLSCCSPWRLLEASRRTLDSRADLRPGPDGRGFRRILHPNGVCLLGTWKIDDAPKATHYSGYFKPGSECLVIARYSTGIGIRRGDSRTLSLVGKLFPTMNPDDTVCTANFITQEELGGKKTLYINDAELRNAPDTTPWQRRLVDLPKLLLTGLATSIADTMPTIRQLYQIAELGKPDAEPTRAPEFMRLRVDLDQPRVYGDDLDFRDEILSHIYKKGVPESEPESNPTLTFNIDVADVGVTKGKLVQRRYIDDKDWKHMGSIVFKEAVASYNGDFVLHFHHPPWRNDRNDPSSVARPRGSS